MAQSRSMTDKWVQALKVEDGREEWTDALTPGLVLRVSARAKAWTLAMRWQGKRYRIKLGTYPLVSLQAARERAVHLREYGPASELPGAELPEAPQTARLVEVIEAYLARMDDRGQASSGAVRAALMTGRYAFARWINEREGRDVLAAEVTPAQVTDWLREVHQRAPASVNHRRAQLHAVFAWAVRAENDPTVSAPDLNFGIKRNPVGDVAKGRPARANPTPVPLDELKRFWEILPDVANPRTVIAVRQIISMGGLRLTETLTSQKSFYRRGWVHLPVTKSGAPHDVPLTVHAKVQLRMALALATSRSPYLYPNEVDITRPMKLDSLSKIVRRAREEFGLSVWQLRDLRATFKTHLIEEERLDERHIDFWHGHGVNTDVARKHYDAAERRAMKLRAARAIDAFLSDSVGLAGIVDEGDTGPLEQGVGIDFLHTA